MGAIIVTDAVHERVELLALAWKVSEGAVVQRLLDEFTKSSRRAAGGTESLVGVEQIHTVYAGQRVEAVYHHDTMRVDITSGVLAGQSFNRPSGAAIAVVQEYKPGVNPNRNGWGFWIVTETGKPLQSIR